MDNSYGNVLSQIDLSKFVMTDRDTAIMAIGTAFGGLQTPLFKRLLFEVPNAGVGILTSTSGLLAVAIGLTCIGVGVGTRLGIVDVNKDVSTFALGYGISCIISLAINVIFSQ